MTRRLHFGPSRGVDACEGGTGTLDGQTPQRVQDVQHAPTLWMDIR